MLTLEKLKEMEPDTIFADGIAKDDVNGINMTNSGCKLRWIAVRGDMHDWAIYYHEIDKSWEFIKQQGDKVHDDITIKKLVACSSDAFNLYRQ